ncbi:MAG TPA: biotin--[acetyl-CoA-carboxylase] ligase [Chlamydiales bacterium]|nr:biotin--[acetyl-CoA-carboxylase] ligase [Chlamydiales bacterium]
MEYQNFAFDSLTSTQDWAKEHVQKFDPEKIACVTAEEQTKGRGRFQRKWITPKGKNICCTLVFRLPADTLHIISLGQIIALSLAKVLIAEKLKPQIKWPNDILLSQKKLAGVLCEIVFEKDEATVFLGIGINVNPNAEELGIIDQPATSLKVETNKTWDKNSLLEKLKKQFAEDLLLFKKEGFTPFHYELENLLAFKHQEIEVFDGQKKWKGILHSLTFDGQLNLCLPDKSMKTISSGDIRGNQKSS